MSLAVSPGWERTQPCARLEQLEATWEPARKYPATDVGALANDTCDRQLSLPQTVGRAWRAIERAPTARARARNNNTRIGGVAQLNHRLHKFQEQIAWIVEQPRRAP